MLKDIFVSEVRVKILKLILPHPEESYHVRAIVRQVGAEINAVRRELANLTDIGLLRRRQSGNRVYYTADPTNIIYPDLLSLVSKEEGICAEIIHHLKNLGYVKYAVVARGFLRGRESSVLDVDLLVVGDVNMDVLNRIVKQEEVRIGRELNYTVMAEDDFMFRKRRNDQFVSKVLSQSRTMIVGDEEEFCSVV